MTANESAGVWTVITVKEAVKQAYRYVEDAFPGVKDLQLEEVELANGDRKWNVTLSYLRPIPHSVTSDPLAIIGEGLSGVKFERVYKVVAVDAKLGKCQSIKIRQLQ